MRRRSEFIDCPDHQLNHQAGRSAPSVDRSQGSSVLSPAPLAQCIHIVTPSSQVGIGVGIPQLQDRSKWKGAWWSKVLASNMLPDAQLVALTGGGLNPEESRARPPHQGWDLTDNTVQPVHSNCPPRIVHPPIDFLICAPIRTRLRRAGPIVRPPRFRPGYVGEGLGGRNRPRRGRDPARGRVRPMPSPGGNTTRPDKRPASRHPTVVGVKGDG